MGVICDRDINYVNYDQKVTKYLFKIKLRLFNIDNCENYRELCYFYSQRGNKTFISC